MSYLNTHARTVSPTSQDNFQPLGRSPALQGVFMGFVKDTTDVQKMGRLRVWIPEFGSAPDEENSWVIVNYCSPFAGATNAYGNNPNDIKAFEGTQTSYGMWMVPPDINNQVLVMFINGDPAKGIWIGCLFNQFMNNMIPGMAADTKNYQYNGKNIPVAEYNKNDLSVTIPDQALHPYEATKFKGLGNQGLITDPSRGVTDSGARRESPSNVFGILTPGPIIDKNVPEEEFRRKGGSSFIMDDGEGTEYVQLATKSGAQIRISETSGYVYIINRDGTGWIQIDQKGNIDVFGARDISLRAQRDFNIRADRNVNIEAGQNIYVKAAKDTNETTTTFTYDVNNVPKPQTIPYWQYVGEGQGQGGNIVTQALNNWQSTTQNSAFLTVIDNNMQIAIGNAFSLTTVNAGQDYNSKMGIKMTTDASYDLAVTGDIRVGANGAISVVGMAGIAVCTQAGMSLNAQDDIKIVSSSNLLLTSLNLVTDASALSFDGTASISGDTKITGALGVEKFTTLGGGLDASGPVALGGPPVLVPFVPAPDTNPTAPDAAQSSAKSSKAEVKPLLEKINILATWKDPASKFKRNAESISTTTTRFPTYEPAPEHEAFTFKSIAGYTPKSNEGDKTYEGSGGAGNGAVSSPATNTTPGANNTDIPPESPVDSAVTKDFNMAAYQCQLKIHEGVKYVAYLDSKNLPTAGIGHLLRANEISQYPINSPVTETQVNAWFNQDAPTSIKGAQELLTVDVWGDLSDIRKRACADLCYNMGKNRLSKFVQFLAAMKAGNFNAAGNALRDSAWFGQVGRRGPNIITMIVSNIDPNGCDKKFPPA